MQNIRKGRVKIVLMFLNVILQANFLPLFGNWLFPPRKNSGGTSGYESYYLPDKTVNEGTKNM
jgi:hypothetical protein